MVAAPLFLCIYNTCLKEATFYRMWKQERLVLLSKREKITRRADILPGTVHVRFLSAFWVVDPLLADNQYGFTKGRTSLEAVNLVVNTDKQAITVTRWKGRTEKYCQVVALGIKNDFSSANWTASCKISKRRTFQHICTR